MAKRDPLQLIRHSSLMMFNESQALADFASEVLAMASDRLRLNIQDAAGTDLEKSVSIQAMHDLLSELDQHLAAARMSLVGHAQKQWIDGYQLQFDGILKQVSAFEAAAPSGLPVDAMARIAKLKPRISGSLIKGVFEGSLNELSGSLAGVKEPIRKIISTNILTGGSYHDLTQEIKGVGLVKGPFKTVEARARAIAITETTNVYNFARYDATEAANRALPEGEKLDYRWSSFMDGKTSPRCKSLNGQVRKQGEDFVASDGWRGKKPAAHPHCRSEIVPFREEWRGILDDLERELLAQVNS